MNAITRRIGDASARRPWAAVAAWLAAVALVLTAAGTLGGSFVDDFVAPGSQSERAMELLAERFPEAAGGSALAVFAVPEGQRLTEHRSLIQDAVDRMDEAEHVVAVADPFTAGTVSADGRIGYAQLTFDLPATDLAPESLAPLNAVLERVRASGVTAELGGDAAFINAETPTSGAEAVGVLVALLVLVVAFGTLVAALVPIVLALVAVAVGLGGIAVLAAAMDVSTAAPTIGAMIGLGVGIDYSLFIVARYRENRAAGQPDAHALSNAMGASGSAVLFAGGTIMLAMVALVLTGVGFLISVGLATSLVVLVAVTTALTLLPALLTLLGDRIDTGRVLRRARTRGLEQSAWWRVAHRVAGRPWPYLLIATAVLVTLAAPALHMRTGFPDAGDDVTATSHRRAYDLLAEGFGPGVNGPLLLVVDQRDRAADIAGLAERVAADPGIVSVGGARTSSDGDTVILPAVPTTAPADPATSETLERLRELAPDNVAVSGMTAMTDDLTTRLNEVLPVFLAAILISSFLLLLIVFRSVAIPLKAAVMNLLSIGGAYGIVVAVFQWGWGAGLLGLDRTYLIASPMPTMFFAILFGLSMDYEVFLLSRIREEYDRTRDNTESVARGMAGTGRVITSAALIMTAVFASFIANPSPLVKMMGLGLAAAIVLDATVVRLVLVPATMTLLGRANWWLPDWLDRLLPRLRTEARPTPRPDVAVPAE
ncbi:MMPL family transporter [Nocardia otitidiscaviarum]|uniref:MMPL family transporter n=1 Tax=Nocardia otitidiscaviarum TaxID=1823 RepID=A0A516NI29_9NOCA|nr:MMPL family transporter [Nocardia otitidiscaviarum]MCP9619979.1 MMPL family transporter [Nocardia otitidiscaviarum]QDP78546.1 MMPL family transporter [Nocardia otitidiscaviarum]